MTAPVRISRGQRTIHVVAELLGLVVVAPFLGNLAMRPGLSRRQRWFLGLSAAGTALVDAYLLVRWAARPSGVAGQSLQKTVGVSVRQIRRYAFASSQDLSPVVGLTHASYALIMLETLEEIVDRKAIAKAGINPKKLRKFITKLQDRHAEGLKKCDPHLRKLLKVERATGGGQIPGFVVAGAPRRDADKRAA